MNAAPITPVRSPSRGLSSGNGKGEQERGKKNRSGSEEENASMRGSSSANRRQESERDSEQQESKTDKWRKGIDENNFKAKSTGGD